MAPPHIRRTVVRHLLAALGVMLVLSTLVTLGLWRLAEKQARQGSERVARQVASAVLVPMADHDFTRPDTLDRADLLEHLTPFLESGMVERVKVFSVEGDVATIAFSDEARVEGLTEGLDPKIARHLDPGQAVVHPAPDDAGHRFETSLAGTRMEVFFGFRDAGGNDTRLELYVPVDVGGMTARSTAVLLPLVLAGLVVLTLALMPLSFGFARRVEREKAEHRAIREYGLAAAELERRDLAQRLHDGVIPDLAGAGLLVERAQASAGEHERDLLGRVHGLLTAEVHDLRAMLNGLLPPEPTGAELRDALEDLVAREEGDAPGTPAITVEVTAIDGLGEHTGLVLRRVAGELVRNAVRHASASSVRVAVEGAGPMVRLTVGDDGAGFDPSGAGRPGHIGLRLVRRVVADNGGDLTVRSAAGAGTTVTVTLPVVASEGPRT